MIAEADRASMVERVLMASTVTLAHARGLTSERDARVIKSRISLISFTKCEVIEAFHLLIRL